MKVHAYLCDRPGCENRSENCDNFTAARKAAEGAGWLIRPSLIKPEHICPACVDELLIATVKEVA